MKQVFCFTLLAILAISCVAIPILPPQEHEDGNKAAESHDDFRFESRPADEEGEVEHDSITMPPSNEPVDEDAKDDEDEHDVVPTPPRFMSTLMRAGVQAPPSGSNTTSKNATLPPKNSTSSTETPKQNVTKPVSNTTKSTSETPNQGSSGVHKQACYKWETSNKTTTVSDPRGGLFSWTKNEKVYVYGGCAGNNHPPGCETTLNIYTKAGHWDTKGITVANKLWLQAVGAAYCYNPFTDFTYEFGGERPTSTGNALTNWLGALAFDKATGHYTWNKMQTSGSPNNDFMPGARQDAALTCVKGAIVLFGGSSTTGFSNTLYAAEVAPTTTNAKWYKPITEGVAPSPRSGLTATYVDTVEGRTIYYFGGADATKTYDDLHALKVPDASSRTLLKWKWTTLSTANAANAPTPRAFHVAAYLPGNRLFIAFGMNAQKPEYYKDARILDLKSKNWLALPSTVKNTEFLVTAMSKGTASVTKNGSEIIVTGGCSGSSCRDVFSPIKFNMDSVCPWNCKNGNYTVVNRQGVCKCLNNWGGKFCHHAQSCSVPCKNGGKCLNGKCSCPLGFGGNDCTTRVCPNGCSNRGDCSETEKRCICKPGFFGLDCSKTACPNNCMGRGICGSNGVCSCLRDFSGKGCEFFKATNKTNATVYNQSFSCVNHCSGNGICQPVVTSTGSKVGVCKCKTGFSGVDCSGECSLHCSSPDAGTCSGADGRTVKCKCNLGYKGPGCSIRYCANNCSDHGICSNGKCFCNSPYSGGACELDTTCSGNGSFAHGKCTCNPGFGGHICEQKVTCPDDCSKQGKCLGAPMKAGEVKASGVCKCNDGWTGPNCAQKECPKKCSGNGFCKATGKCDCYSGYGGPDCATVIACPNNCTGTHGVCQPDALNPAVGKCKCSAAWSGLDCSKVGCPHNCYGHGECKEGKCLCARGYSGANCEIQCPNKCSGHGICADGACTCHPGFSGHDCNTTAVCPGKPMCSNNGKCFHATGECFCKPGFTGSDCSRVQTCGPKGCGNGICKWGECHCKPGYAGKHCELSTTCKNDCNKHGHCIGGACVCDHGFKGAACETFVQDNSCPKNCSSKGVCFYGRCHCVPGQTGPDCSIPTNLAACKRTPTSKHLCEGRGSCIMAKCFCNPGFAGQFCDKPEKCASGCVQGQGICMNQTCACLPGYKGPDCSEEMTCEGSPTSCSGNGVCNRGKCACLPGYAGRACEKLKPSLAKLSCPGNCTDGGVCHMGRCFCVPGRTGKDCSIRTQNACPANCNKRGSCAFGTCFCKPGFTGKACEGEVKCSAECTKNGVCAYGKCHCVPGWTGEQCNKQITRKQRDAAIELDIKENMKLSAKLSPKNPRFCAGGCGTGVCINHTCACPSPYKGKNCEHIVGGPLTHRCANNCTGHGACVLGKCLCEPGFAGKTCERAEVYSCPNNCNSNGRCQWGRCYCKPGFTGHDCSEVSKCGPCVNGKCQLGKCTCLPGYTGNDCSVKATSFREVMPEATDAATPVPLVDMLGLSECENNCGGNGLCVNKECYCKPGYVGRDCSKVQGADDGFPHFRAELSSELPTPVEVSEDAHVSYTVLSSLSFLAGGIFCMLVQFIWNKRTQMKQQQAQKALFKPLLHSIDA